MDVSFKTDKILAEYERKIKDSLELTGLAIISDVEEAMVVPKASGVMESTLRPLDVSAIDQFVVYIGNDTPYARRWYLNNEGVSFHQEPWEGGEGNTNARDHWFEPWLSGERRPWVQSVFESYMERMK